MKRQWEEKIHTIDTVCLLQIILNYNDHIDSQTIRTIRNIL